MYIDIYMYIYMYILMLVVLFLRYIDVTTFLFPKKVDQHICIYIYIYTIYPIYRLYNIYKYV